MEQLQIRHLEVLNEARLVAQPFSEADIIELHNRFITPGFHSLKVANMQEGRSLMHTILASLNYHHNVVCLTASQEPLEAYVQHAYQSLKRHGQIDEQAIFDYFLDDFNADFLWIEMSAELMAQPWFTHFQQMMHDFHLDQHIPIVMLSYEQ